MARDKLLESIVPRERLKSRYTQNILHCEWSEVSFIIFCDGLAIFWSSNSTKSVMQVILHIYWCGHCHINTTLLVLMIELEESEGEGASLQPIKIYSKMGEGCLVHPPTLFHGGVTLA